MKDNSGNTIDPSGQLITFNRNDPSNNIFSSYNLFGNDENRDNDPYTNGGNKQYLNC